MKPQTIGVILPLFNHETFLPSCINSVLNQTLPVDEIILIDDGSTDQGFALAEAILGNDPRARLLKQANQGTTQTINKAIELSQSDFLAILNTDDLFAPKKIEYCKELLQTKPETEMICGAISIIDTEGRIMLSGETLGWLHRADDFQRSCHSLDAGILHDNYVMTTSNMVFSRALWKRCEGFQELRYCHDLDFLLTALTMGTVAIDSDHTHTYYRLHANNTIKENRKQLDVERAAVIANALNKNSARIVRKDHAVNDLLQLCSILAARGHAHLICALLTVRTTCSSRTEFYEHLRTTNCAEHLISEFMS